MTRDEALARNNLREFLKVVGESRGLHVVRDKFPCPELAHAQSGATPPASVQNRNGTDVWYCHTCEKGGTIIDAMVASGRAQDIGDALEQLGVDPPAPRSNGSSGIPEGEPVAAYVYTDEAGQPLYRVLRYEPKDFRQQRFEDGQWRWKGGMAGVRLVPYRLPRVLAALERQEWVFIVEGEKDAEALEAAGRVATTSPGGAKKWRDDYTALLTRRDARIVIIADDDSDGHKHARMIERSLLGKVGVVVVRRPAKGFKDVAEQLAKGIGVNHETLRKLPEAVLAPGERVGGGPLMLSARAMSARPSLGDEMQVVGPLFQRGMRTTIGAQTGEGKTTMSLQVIRSLITGEPFLGERWRPRRVGKALIIDLEQGEETLKRRLREAGLAESEAVDVLWEPSGLALDSDTAHQELVRETVRAGGYDLVLVDPLYQMHRGNANDERTAADLMRLVDGWARDFNFSLVIPMHARKPHPQAGKQMTIHDIAGSGSWNRNAEFVLGMQLMSAGNSRLWFFKDRIGDGPDIPSHWWLAFDREGGFRRTYQETHEAVAKTMKALVTRPEGATRAELEAVPGADAEADLGRVSVKALLAKCTVDSEGHWHFAPKRRKQQDESVIPGQTSFADGGMV